MIKNKKILDFSKRKFNIYFLFSVLFFSFSRSSASVENKRIKKIKSNNYVWYLNEND